MIFVINIIIKESEYMHICMHMHRYFFFLPLRGGSVGFDLTLLFLQPVVVRVVGTSESLFGPPLV